VVDAAAAVVEQLPDPFAACACAGPSRQSGVYTTGTIWPDLAVIDEECVDINVNEMVKRLKRQSAA
jgi:hypothetical protein